MPSIIAVIDTQQPARRVLNFPRTRLPKTQTIVPGYQSQTSAQQSQRRGLDSYSIAAWVLHLLGGYHGGREAVYCARTPWAA